MGQVFGDIDERKTAAVKLQKLRQVTSVRQYITEFQTITANLEWDEEALNDKFEEGLKPEIRKALIFYPREQKDLEELFERAQKLIEKCGTETIIMIAIQQNPIAITAKIRRGIRQTEK
jgi:Retrotransposon gag protein